MLNPILQVEGIHAFYGGMEVLHGVSLHVFPGEIVVLFGANGAGKTTTLKTISNLVKKGKGRVRFNGQDTTEYPAHKLPELGLAHVPEGRHVFPKLTVEENLRMGCYCRKNKQAIKAKTEEMCDLFPILRTRWRQAAGTMSGGEQQMLAIARGLMLEPKLLLLDEPSLGLMPRLVDEMFLTIQKLNKTGLPILLVEQNVYESMHIAHRYYILEIGRIVSQGAVSELQIDEELKRAYLGI